MSIREMNDREEFWNSIIAQDDDCDWEESGYVIVSDGNEAAIARYGHCSCYGTWTAIHGGDWSDSGSGNIIWDWSGTVDELLKMARYKLDPHYSLGSRKADKNDCDYDHLMIAYGQVLEWNRNGRPMGTLHP